MQEWFRAFLDASKQRRHDGRLAFRRSCSYYFDWVDRMTKRASSVFDVPPDEAVEARADAAAEADVKAGHVVADETVREWLARLVKGEKVPPPSA